MTRKSVDFDPSALPQSPSRLSRSPTSRARQRTLSGTGTFRAFGDFEDFEGQQDWRPGAEPGIDPSKPDGGWGTAPTLQAECRITVVDFSRDNLEVHRLNNSELLSFIELPKPDWVTCRWINVNGLSWDVIQALGSYKNLDPLNIEDTMTTSNLAKVDWHQDQAFIMLTCQKLVRLTEDDSGQEDEGGDDTKSVKSIGSVKGIIKKFRRLFPRKEAQHTTLSMLEKGIRPPQYHSTARKPTGCSHAFNPSTLCSLQGYRAPRNTPRTKYMMEHSPLASRGLAIVVEQSSMFVTADNTIISFFEQSANDVEEPILLRLATPTTVLRRHCEASMVLQAILDAIMDMTLPIAMCYRDVLSDLELDILNRPKVKDTRKIYIIVTEINKLFNLVNPIQTLIKTLRDRAKLSQKVTSKEVSDCHHGMSIAPEAAPYLSDVYDHCALFNRDLALVKQSAENMVQLIFNTVLTKQSGNMKTLAVISAAFLPAMFLTSYFGQNFLDFPAIHEKSFLYFWYIALPIVFATIVVAMHDTLYEWFKELFLRDRRRSGKKVVIKIQKTE
ncbi:hypothetical protein F4805DRAFT_465432 [Annulohypoxylon moriforme]|nr:hypothetical protein F4805DRAFT_465432 [Annulohypoxylon moriforme]